VNSLASLARAIDAFNERVGRITAWAALIMVMVQFVVVVMRYVFGIGALEMQESIIYMHSILFLVGAGYTLLHGGHVRVDVFYQGASTKTKAWVDLLGVIFLLIPVCALVWWASYPYVSNSWRVLEGSVETSGIPAVFLLKTLILVFSVLVAIQGVSLAIRSAMTIMGVAGPEDSEEEPYGA
jgi:TRAP-type mannitol/chloroaromatic compound transport system permease small subunit